MSHHLTRELQVPTNLRPVLLSTTISDYHLPSKGLQVVASPLPRLPKIPASAPPRLPALVPQLRQHSKRNPLPGGDLAALRIAVAKVMSLAAAQRGGGINIGGGGGDVSAWSDRPGFAQQVK